MGLLLLYLFGAMAVSFLCSLLESVLMSAQVSFITMREEDGDRNARLFMRFKQEPDRPLAAILSLNTIANTIGAAGVGYQTNKVFGNEWFGLVSALMTLLILVFSEIIPKTIGTSQWRRLLWLSRPMKLLVTLMYPLVILIELFRKRLDIDEVDTSISREEVSAMAGMAEEEGIIDKSENKVIQNIIKLDDIKAYDVMTPRVVAAIAPESMTLKEFYKDESLSHNSRIPVYADSPEFITGYVLRYDVLELLTEDKFSVKLSSVKRPIAVFNEEATVSDIWESLLKTKDIIETILGMEIIDENDTVTDMQQYARERWQQRQKQFKPLNIPD